MLIRKNWCKCIRYAALKKCIVLSFSISLLPLFKVLGRHEFKFFLISGLMVDYLWISDCVSCDVMAYEGIDSSVLL